jgi:hypothetical protein
MQETTIKHETTTKVNEENTVTAEVVATKTMDSTNEENNMLPDMIGPIPGPSLPNLNETKNE